MSMQGRDISVIEVKDRVPTKPNRKKITYDDGRVEYAKIEYADEPTEQGTPINKVLFENIRNDFEARTEDNIQLIEKDGAIEKGTTLENATWEQINTIANAGFADTYWNVGDEKNIVVSGETLTLVIVGFNHDNLETGGKAAITFGLKNLMNNNRAIQSYSEYYNSPMDEWLNGDLYNSLPDDLKSIIKNVYKGYVKNGASSYAEFSPMKIFLFSESEIFDSIQYATPMEGLQYPYFKTAANRIKTKNDLISNYPWSTRSKESNSDWVAVSTNGTVQLNDRENSIGVCFAFCIGESGSQPAYTLEKPVRNDVTNVIAKTLGIDDTNLKIETGSYTGAGYTGESYPNILIFSDRPKLLFVYNPQALNFSNNTGFLIIPYGVNAMTSNNEIVNINWNECKLTWYASSTTTQLNESDTTYQYLALI